MCLTSSSSRSSRYPLGIGCLRYPVVKVRTNLGAVERREGIYYQRLAFRARLNSRNFEKFFLRRRKRGKCIFAERSKGADIAGRSEHIADIRIPDFALRILNLLEDAGFEAWIVGGYVRDAIMGRAAADIDIATDARWEDVQRICETAGAKTYKTGVKHGTITVSMESADGCWRSCEVTTYRSDGAYSDARHPDKVVFVTSIEEDLGRRDFTMNAIAYNPSRGSFDPYCGIDDIKRKLIRTVGDAPQRFSEDALRILRACRFSSQLGFSIEDASYDAMVANKSLLSRVSTERIAHELDELLMGDHMHDALLRNVDVLAYPLPELVAMKNCAQATKYHSYDVLEHTAYTVQNSPKDRAIRWAALCHDMGKPASAFFDENGVEHFYGHAQASARIARGLLDRLLMGSAFKNEVVALVENHNDPIVPTKRSVRRALVRVGGDAELFGKLVELKRADMLAHAPRYAAESIAMDEVLEILDALVESDEAFCLKKLAINGDDLLALGIKPGKTIGRLLNNALDAVANGEIRNEKETLIGFCKDKMTGE